MIAKDLINIITFLICMKKKKGKKMCDRLCCDFPIIL